MPTAYTADVQSGKVTDFKDFAMQCARAFGACITMRDDPNDADIPDQFEPSDYHLNEVAEAKKELARLASMTDEQKSISALEAYNIDCKVVLDRQQLQEAHRARYEAMLKAVEAWSPPTNDHVEMKRFMERQLRESIDFDCRPYGSGAVRMSGSEWHDGAIAKARRDIEYHTNKYAEEVERCEKRTEWVRALRASL